MEYQNELRKLKALVNKNVWEMFQKHNVIIAGGAITSVFCNREVNDIDVYFRNAKDYLKFVFDIFEGEHRFELIVNNITDRSVLLRDKYTNQDVQLIIYKFFENELAIFKDYDFTCNMGALIFNNAAAQFVLHPEFLKHNSQRYLSFNDGTAYPLISALRVAKYVEKGYSISKAQMLRVLMAVNDVSLTTWEEVKDHVGGMYGLNMEDVFPVQEDFSLKKAMDCLDKLFSDGIQYKNNKSFDLATLYAPVAKYFEDVPGKKENASNRFFKNVKKLSDGKLVSFYNPKFEYKVGEYVNGGREGVWAHKGNLVISGTYSYEPNKVILELQGNQMDTYDTRLEGDVLVKAVYTQQEFKEKFDCGVDIPQHVRDFLDDYECGEEQEEDF